MHSKLKPIAEAVPVLARIEEVLTARGIIPEVQNEGDEHSFDHYSPSVEAEGWSVQLQWALPFRGGRRARGGVPQLQQSGGRMCRVDFHRVRRPSRNLEGYSPLRAGM